MRRLLVALALLVAACDSTVGPADLEDDIVGTWVLVEETSETLVTSRVDQSVPNFRVRGEGGIVVAGALEDRLNYVSSLDRYSEAVQGVDAQIITLVSRPGFDLEDGPFTIFRADSSANPPAAIINRVAADAETYYGGLFPAGTGPFSYREGRLTVPTVEVVSEDGLDRRITVGGTLTFPLVALHAGRESVLSSEVSAIEDERTVTFNPDGGYRESGAAATTLGRWRRDSSGDVIVEMGTVARRLGVGLEGERLELRYQEPAEGAGCVLECVSSTEANLFAPLGSISTVRYTSTATYRRVSDV